MTVGKIKQLSNEPKRVDVVRELKDRNALLQADMFKKAKELSERQIGYEIERVLNEVIDALESARVNEFNSGSMDETLRYQMWNMALVEGKRIVREILANRQEASK